MEMGRAGRAFWYMASKKIVAFMPYDSKETRVRANNCYEAGSQSAWKLTVNTATIQQMVVTQSNIASYRQTII